MSKHHRSRATASGISRRRAIQQLGLASLALSAAGGCTTAPGAGPEGAKDGGGDGALPALGARELLASVDNIVVVMMENRSFDHYFGALTMDPRYPAAARVNGLTGNESNPDPGGGRVPVYRQASLTEANPPHDWDPCHLQWNNGRNDGFVIAHKGAFQSQVMGYHDREQLPVLYALADQYVVCDRWFSSVMGPTWPNRFYLHATTAKGKRDNTPFLSGAPTTIWEALKEAGRSAKNYRAGIIAWYSGAFLGNALKDSSHIAPLDDFFKDAAAGKLPSFSLIDPDYLFNDDHPSHSIQLGQALLGSIVKALAQSPQWGRSLLLITYDEHGGFYDHVPPPLTVDPELGFEQLGLRVPTVVVGPTVHKGAVVSTQYEHVSVAATLAARFGMRSLGARMDATRDVSACIDPARVRAGTALPPPTLPQLLVDLPQLLRGARVHSQPELLALAQAGRLPASAAGSPEEELLRWFRHAEALGAVVNTGGAL